MIQRVFDPDSWVYSGTDSEAKILRVKIDSQNFLQKFQTHFGKRILGRRSHSLPSSPICCTKVRVLRLLPWTDGCALRTKLKWSVTFSLNSQTQLRGWYITKDPDTGAHNVVSFRSDERLGLLSGHFRHNVTRCSTEFLQSNSNHIRVHHKNTKRGFRKSRKRPHWERTFWNLVHWFSLTAVRYPTRLFGNMDRLLLEVLECR